MYCCTYVLVCWCAYVVVHFVLMHLLMHSLMCLLMLYVCSSYMYLHL